MAAKKTAEKRQAAPAIKRRKPEADVMDTLLRVRVNAEQKQIFSEAAARAGLDVSSWLRSIGLAAAQKDAK